MAKTNKKPTRDTKKELNNQLWRIEKIDTILGAFADDKICPESILLLKNPNSEVGSILDNAGLLDKSRIINNLMLDTPELKALVISFFEQARAYHVKQASEATAKLQSELKS